MVLVMQIRFLSVFSKSVRKLKNLLLNMTKKNFKNVLLNWQAVLQLLKSVLQLKLK